jgi:hypothetical protein
VVFQSRIGDDDFGKDRTTPLPQNGEDVSRLRRTHSAVKTGITVILQRERRNRRANIPATYQLVSRLPISLGLSPPRAGEESRLCAANAI